MYSAFESSLSSRSQIVPLNVLVVKKHLEDAHRLVQAIRRAGYEIKDRIVQSTSDMAAVLAAESFDLILSDWQSPSPGGPQPFEVYRQSMVRIPFIVYAETADQSEAIAALRAGVSDYVTRDCEWIGIAIERALRDVRARRETLSAQDDLQRIYSDLERRIGERTSDMAALNERLQEEVRERQRAQDQLHLAIAGSEGCIWTITLDDNDPYNVPEQLTIPARQKEMIGFADDEFPNSFSAWQARIHPHDLPRVKKENAELLAGQATSSEIEYRVLHRDGTYRWLYLRGSLSRDASGRPVEWNRIVWDITARKLSEQAIIQQKDQLLIAIEGSEGMIWSVEADPTHPHGWSDYIDMDPRMKQFLGYAEDEFPNSRQEWDGRIPEEHRYRVHRAMMAHAIGDKERFHVEYPIKHREGHLVWVSMRGTVIRNEQGLAERMIGMMWDITDRKRHEERLAESEARFRVLFDQSPDGIFIQQNEKICFVNRAFLTMMRAESHGQFVGSSIWQHIHTDYHQVIRERIASRDSGMPVTPLEEVWIRLDGTEIEVEASGSLLSWQGQPAIQIVLRDITYRRQAERMIKESQQKLERAAAMAQLGYWEGIPDGSSIWMSPGLYQILGLDPSVQMSRSMYMQMIHPEDRSSVQQTIANALVTDQTYEIEFRLVRPNGDERIVHARGEITHDAAGRPLKSFGAIQDITDRTLAERALRESEERLGLAMLGTGMAMWDVDLRTNVAVWSDSFYRMLGYNPAMTLASYDKWVKALHPMDRDRVLREIENARLNKTTYSAEYRIIYNATDEVRWQHATGRFLYDHTDNPSRFLGVVVDTTERKRDEEQLRELYSLANRHAAELGAVIEAMPDAVYIGTQEGITHCNTNALRMLGARSLSDLQDRIGELGKKFNVRWPETGIPLTVDELQFTRALKGEMAVEEVLATNAETGSDVFIRSACAPIIEDGHVIGAVAINSDITERRQAEESLRRSEAILAEVGHMAHLGAWYIDVSNSEDLNANRLQWSDETFRIFGYEPRSVEVTNQLFFSHIPPEDRARIVEGVRRAVAGDGIYELEHRIIRVDGAERIVLERAEVSFDGQRRPRYILGAVQDITESKRAEERLREREATLSSIYTSSPLLMGIAEPLYHENDIVHLYDNPATCRFFGVDEGATSGKLASQLGAPPEAIQMWLEQYRRCEDTGESVTFEYSHQANGSAHWLSSTISQIETSASGRIRFSYITEDISERKRAEAALMESEERFRDLFENAPLGIYRTTPDGRILLANPVLLEMLGFSSLEELAARNLELEGFEPEYSRSQFLERINRDGYIRGLEAAWLRRDGTTIFVRENARLVKDDNGNTLYFEGIIEDITERKRAEKALSDAEQRYASLFNASITGLAHFKIVTDENGVPVDYVVTAVNDAYEKIIGVKRADIEGKLITEVFPTIRESDFDFIGEYGRVGLERGELQFETYFEPSGKWLSVYAYSPRPGETTAIFSDITERKRAEEALRESEERLKSVIENLAEGLIIVDLRSATLHWNRAAMEMHGYTANDRDLVSPELMVDTYELATPDNTILPFEDWPIPRILREDILHDCEMLLRHKERNWQRLFSYSGALMRDADGHPYMALLTIRDVSKRRMAEEALRQSEARFRNLADAMPQLVWTAEPDGTVDYYNRRYEEYSGIRQAEDGTYHWAPVLHPDDVQPTVDAWQLATDTGTTYQIEHRVQTGTGTYRWHLSRGIPVRNEHGEVVKWFGTATDIHDTKTAEEALRESEERLRATFNNAGVGIVEVETAEDRIIAANEHICEILNRPYDELLGMTIHELTHPEDRPRSDDLNGQLRSGRMNRVDYEKRYLKGDGSSIWVHVTVSAVRDSYGRWLRSIATIEDISKRKRAEAALRAALDETERNRGQLEAVFQAVNDGVVVSDMHGNFILINDAEARINGYPSAETMSHDLAYFAEVYELRYPDGQLVPVADWPINRVLRGESIINWELRGYRRDTGREWYFSFSGEPVRDEEDNQILAVIITRDITEFKQTESALSESEERFRTMINSIPQLAWMADDTGSIFWYSDRWYQYTGTTPQEMQSLGWQATCHPDHVERVTEKLSRHWESGDPWEDTFPMRDKDGQYRWFLSRALPIRDANGGITRWFGTNTDITEQLQTQQALLENEELLRTAMDSMPAAVAIVDTDLRVVRMNKFGFQVTALTPEQVLGRRPDEALSLEQAQILMEPLIECRDTALPVTVERVLEFEAGRFHSLLTFVPLYRDGRVYQIVAVAYDISELKRVEDELRHAHDELEQRVFERTGELIEANKLLVREVEERTLTEQKLLHATQQLEQERSVLERKNIALKEVLGQIDSEKSALKTQMTNNIEQIVMPILRRLKEAPRSASDRLISILEQDLREITAPLQDNLKASFDKLSPREIEVCRLIKNGFATKEIAEALNLSPMTIQKHRELIRKKLGLTNESVNLQSYLQTLSESGVDLA